ncbi:MAG: type II toxin-antitoxin system RelE/ParE family toxin [Desulfobacterales bacterium]|nr:type II toxin-antitoxin system RelE/ParE family toxin [Desulfobacterales bacterium]
MIKTFQCKETKKIFNRSFSKKLPTDIQRTALKKLVMLNNSTTLNDLKIPTNNNLELLQKDRKGQYSININKQWRICFNWINNNAYNVEIVDYH